MNFFERISIYLNNKLHDKTLPKYERIFFNLFYAFFIVAVSFSFIWYGLELAASDNNLFGIITSMLGIIIFFMGSIPFFTKHH